MCAWPQTREPVTQPEPVTCVRAAVQTLPRRTRTQTLSRCSAEHRAQQLRRLKGRGEEPSEEELGVMHWPQRAWWDDRDRIGECPPL